jgi:hypothetical protein
MLGRAVAVLAFVIIAAGCATTSQTPAQARTWAAIEQCQRETGLQFDDVQVRPDGSWRTFSNVTQSATLMGCLKAAGLQPRGY